VRILIYGLNYAPELTGIGKYSGEMAEWLAAEGHEVRVVTAPMYYPAWRIGAGFSGTTYASELRSDVKVIRCPLYVPQRPSGARRMLHLFSWAASSLPVVLWQALRWRPDVVLTVAPTFFCAPAALAAARIGGAQSWLHLQDLEIDAAFELGLLPEKLKRLAYTLEHKLLRCFGRISTISSRMLDKIHYKGVPRSRLSLFRNWVDTTSIFPSKPSACLREKLGLPENKIIALYSGNMGEKQGLEIILDAARELSAEPRIHFLLCGDGAARERLVSQAEGLANVSFAPLQPLDRLNDLMNLAQIHLLVQRPGAADLVMPSKLATILACGGPVVATAAPGTELSQVVMDAAGVLCPPGDSRQLAACIRQLAEDPSLRGRISAQARQYAEKHLGKEQIMKAFEADMSSLCRGVALYVPESAESAVRVKS